MKIVRTVAQLREALAPRRAAGERIGLVPTMGAFHEGHLALMRRARETCDAVVVSLFVNPPQFRPGEDLAAYPRDEASDVAKARQEGIDVLFAPGVEEVYPDGFATTVAVAGVTAPLEGEARGPEHFDGVTTVVCKLLNMAGPHVAFFGQKDAQQAVVVRRLVRDLDMPVEVQVLPTVREADGLALSSRNAYLAGEDRERALALRAALEAAHEAVARGERKPGGVRAAALAAMDALDVSPEYLELVHPDTLAPVEALDGDVLVAVAAQVGPARLIDNTLIHANGTQER